MIETVEAKMGRVSALIGSPEGDKLVEELQSALLQGGPLSSIRFDMTVFAVLMPSIVETPDAATASLELLATDAFRMHADTYLALVAGNTDFPERLCSTAAFALMLHQTKPQVFQLSVLGAQLGETSTDVLETVIGITEGPGHPFLFADEALHIHSLLQNATDTRTGILTLARGIDQRLVNDVMARITVLGNSKGGGYLTLAQHFAKCTTAILSTGYGGDLMSRPFEEDLALDPTPENLHAYAALLDANGEQHAATRLRATIARFSD